MNLTLDFDTLTCYKQHCHRIWRLHDVLFFGYSAFYAGVYLRQMTLTINFLMFHYLAFIDFTICTNFDFITFHCWVTDCYGQVGGQMAR